MTGGGLDALLDSLSAPAAAPPGWFGKLAMLGDFAHRRLPPEFIALCDPWLSAGLAASRDRLGEARWLEVYLNGPLWRFAWAPGVLDARWWFGLMMPSVDKVGRYFPLVVAQSADAAPQDAQSLGELEVWYEHLGAAALATLQPQADVDAFEAALARLPTRSIGEAARRPDASRLPGRRRLTLDGSASLAQWVAGWGSLDAMNRCAGHSLWWPDHATAPDNSLSITPGLPDAEHFALLLEGAW